MVADADGGTALFTAPTPPFGEDDFYARQADGSLLDVGPVRPPSDGPTPVGGSFPPLVVAETADLSHVLFEMQFPGSWPFDATIPGLNSLFEYVGAGNSQPVLVGVSGGPRSTDLIGRCSTSAPKLGAGYGAMSADGDTVFFEVEKCASGSGANANIEVPAFTLYARIGGARTVLISGRSPLGCTSAACTSSPPADAAFYGASRDGSKVFFADTQQLTDNASEDSRGSDTASYHSRGCPVAEGVNGCNLYEYDFGNPAGRNLLAVSTGDTSGGGPRVQGVVAVSADGSYVYFVAKGVLSGAANSAGQSAQDGAENLYVFERDAVYPAGRVAFVAALSNADYELWQSGSGGVIVANVTPEGRFLVFTSHADLTRDDSSAPGAAQVFRYDAQTGELIRVSVGEDGFNDNGNAGTGPGLFAGRGPGLGDARIVSAAASDLRRDPTMSDDGAYVFFQSPVGLTPQALDDVPIDSEGDLAQNVYEWHEGQVFLISDGRDTSTSNPAPENEGGKSSVVLLGSSASGADVFFSTTDRLVAQDTDTQLDVYDARIGGGFPFTAPGAPCQGEGCRGAPEAPPLSSAPASAIFSGAGNLAPAAAKPVVKPKKAKKKTRPTRGAHGRKKARRGKTDRKTARVGKHVKRGRR